MRIALLTYSTRPRGGVVHTLALAEALAARGTDVTVLTVGRGGDRSCYRPVDPAVDLRVQPLGERPGEGVGERVVRSIAALGAGLDAAERFDVVHAQDCISANACLSAGTGDRLVRTVHHIDQFTTPQLAACHERAIVAPAAHVCVSAAVAEELRVGWGIEAQVIANGVDARRFRTAAGNDARAVANRRHWRHHIGSPYLLTVGGIEPRKGTIDLLEAWALLCPEIPDLALVIAGGETLFDYREYRARFDRRVADLGIAPVMLGPIAHDDLPALVAGAAVFALASTKEGFGLAAMEALAAGVPVVLRDLPVLREVFTATARFGRDPSELAAAIRASLDGLSPGASAPALVDARTWEAAAQAHQELYADLVATRNRTGGRVETACSPARDDVETSPP